ncbi:MAG: FecR family protein [Bacteroidota bacterium]
MTDAELKKRVSTKDYLAYLKLKKGLETFDSLEGSIEPTFSKITNRLDAEKPKGKYIQLRWIGSIAASIIVLLGLFMFLQNDTTSHETGFGEHKSIVLLDGSEVLLNSKSQLSYDESKWDSQRMLHLEGEAFFKVAKGKKFTVITSNGEVSVLGTQFNVNSTESYFDVVCYEGKVGVKTKTSNHILMPGDEVRKINGFDVETFKTSKYAPTWIDGESTFKSVPLHYVLKAMEKEFEVVFDTSEIDEDVVFTGGFPNDDLNLALKTVFGPLDITYFEKEKRNIKLGHKR